MKFVILYDDGQADRYGLGVLEFDTQEEALEKCKAFDKQGFSYRLIKGNVVLEHTGG